MVTRWPFASVWVLSMVRVVQLASRKQKKMSGSLAAPPLMLKSLHSAPKMAQNETLAFGKTLHTLENPFGIRIPFYQNHGCV